MKNTKKTSIFVYGLDSLGFSIPDKTLVETDYAYIYFGRLGTRRSFDESDGVILFEGIFNNPLYSLIKRISGSIYATNDGTVYTDEILLSTLAVSGLSKEFLPRQEILERVDFGREFDRRKREKALLLEKKGFICYLLVRIYYQDQDREVLLPELSSGLENIKRRVLKIPNHKVEIKTASFKEFLRKYTEYYTFFEYSEETAQHSKIKELCLVDSLPTGIVINDNEFFIPTAIPDEKSLQSFFTILSKAVTLIYDELSDEPPHWIDDYRFGEENHLLLKVSETENILKTLNSKLSDFREFKKCLYLKGDPLVESIFEVLRNGVGIKVITPPDEENIEDLRILNEDGGVIALVEVKGENAGVKNEHINQVDTHRERRGYQQNDIKSILIFNGNLRNMVSLEDRYFVIHDNQKKHAKNNNVLILRTIDLLNLLYLKLSGKLSNDDIRKKLIEEKGFLDTTVDPFKTMLTL